MIYKGGIYIKFSSLKFLLPLPIIYLWFYLLEQNVVPVYFMKVVFDDYFPFVPVFIIPYLLWFPFMYGLCAYFWFKSDEDFKKTLSAIYFGFVICLIIYTLFPNGQSLRPAHYNNDIFSQTIKLFQSKDTPTNVAPSLHVYISLVLYSAITKSKCFVNKKGFKVFSLVLVILICFSTVFLKQHSVIDGLMAIVLWGMCYVIFYAEKSPKLTTKYGGFHD